MNRRTFLKTVPAFTVLAARASSFAQDAGSAFTATPNAVTTASATQQVATASVPAGDLQPITLPRPQKDGGTSVLAALWDRRTTRNIREDALEPQVLSNLLWAAFGVNRENGPSGRVGRTAASASNSQEIDLYVVLPEGIYLYEAVPHRLTPIVAGDQRAKVGRGRRGAGATAPVNIIYVVDLAKYGRGRPQEPGLRDTEIQRSYYNVAVGLIAGNVYLFAASQGLGAWFRNCNRDALAEELKLRPEQRVVYAHTVGYPA